MPSLRRKRRVFVNVFAMSRQVVGAHERLAAGSAGVGAVEGMGALVPRQLTGPREGLAAGGAFVGAVAGMGAHVFHQMVDPREVLAAGGARVGAVAGMGALVRLHVAERGEGLLAGGAREGADAGMGALVRREGVGAREGLATNIAGPGARLGFGFLLSPPVAHIRDDFFDDLTLLPSPPLLARESRAPTPSSTRRAFQLPFDPDQSAAARRTLARWSSPCLLAHARLSLEGEQGENCSMRTRVWRNLRMPPGCRCRSHLLRDVFEMWRRGRAERGVEAWFAVLSQR